MRNLLKNDTRTLGFTSIHGKVQVDRVFEYFRMPNRKDHALGDNSLDVSDSSQLKLVN